MARAQSRYVCQECGAAHPRWSGRCDACGGWNTIVEEEARESTPKGLGRAKGRKLAFSDLAGESAPLARHQTGIAELDRVFGGGLVPGSALLVSGDPGIGKSTLLLQAVAQLAKGGMQAAYISGEESVDQIRLRAARLELADAPVKLATTTNIRDILTNLEPAGGPDVVVIDSIQTMFVDTLDSAPGTVAQLRTGAQELIRFAKRRGTILFLVGHVTKEGLIAGPRVLEHMVDTVLYFEGERGHQFRILRAIKNRFGPTDEIGVFEMTGKGLAEVPNPSALFLNTEHGPIAGAAVFAGIEGTRPVLVEIQALVASSALATPRRAVVGWDSARLAMLLAVLDARCGLALGANDVYLNVAGGLRISEPAADLAVAAALLSSLTDTPVPEKTVLFGEVGLAGEIRSVGQVAARLKEAAKLGFSHAFAPAEGREAPDLGIELCPLAELVDLVAIFERPDKRARGVS
ncbi:MAG: DNA repair protein RadA [Alphaproteobacteria bacterium]